MSRILLPIFCCFVLTVHSNAIAGDPYYSNVKISAFKAGSYGVTSESKTVYTEYFCVHLTKTDFNKKACVTAKFGASKDAFNTLYSMAYSSYLSRAELRAYIVDDTFIDTNFISDNSPNMLTQLETCGTSVCFDMGEK